jgi:hypothetical protein
MSSDRYSALIVAPRTGSEPFHTAGIPTGFDVAAFWRWLASDLAGNALRGVLAEFLVAQAVNARGAVRVEWDACDLITGTGARIEVKSAAYLQTWAQRKLSTIKFGIGATRGDTATNPSLVDPCRSADVYVFALLAHQEKATLDPLDLTQWRFYVVSRRVLDATFGAQKSIALSSLIRVSPKAVLYEDLGSAVALAAESSTGA